MGEIKPGVYLTGTKYSSKRQMLMTMGEKKPTGKFMASATGAVNCANWQYPNFISKAYGESTSLSFIGSMGIRVEFGCDLNVEKDCEKLKTDINNFLVERDAKRAFLDIFQRQMRGDKPSNDN